MTNNEKINNMSVEEKAKFFRDHIPCDMCPIHDDCGVYGSCTSTWIIWLDKEATDD